MTTGETTATANNNEGKGQEIPTTTTTTRTRLVSWNSARNKNPNRFQALRYRDSRSFVKVSAINNFERIPLRGESTQPSFDHIPAGRGIIRQEYYETKENSIDVSRWLNVPRAIGLKLPSSHLPFYRKFYFHADLSSSFGRIRDPSLQILANEIVRSTNKQIFVSSIVKQPMLATKLKSRSDFHGNRSHEFCRWNRRSSETEFSEIVSMQSLGCVARFFEKFCWFFLEYFRSFIYEQ